MKRIGFLPLVLVLAISPSLYAQEAGAASSGKVIDVDAGASRPQSRIALRPDRPSGFWGASFPRITDWKMPAGQEPIQVINFSAKLVGDKAELIVSVFKGKRFGEIVEPVVTLMLSEGDTAVVDGLAKYGYQPITVKFLTSVLGTANIPSVSSPTSVRVVVTPAVSAIPAFNVQVFNDSGKAIIAMPWHTQVSGRRSVSSMPRGQHGNSLILPNGTWEATIKTPNAKLSDTLEFVIDAIAYADGAVDGDRAKGSAVFAINEGDKKALARLVPLLEASIKASGESFDVAKLIQLIDSVTENGESVEAQAARQGFLSYASISFEDVVADLLKEFRKLEAGKSNKTVADLRRSVVTISAFYEAWLARLDK